MYTGQTHLASGWVAPPDFLSFLEPPFSVHFGPNDGDTVPAIRKPQNVFTTLGRKCASVQRELSVCQASTDQPGREEAQSAIQLFTTLKETHMKTRRDTISTYYMGMMASEENSRAGRLAHWQG